MGVAITPPRVPVLDTVMVPPCSSSSLSVPARAPCASRSISRARSNSVRAPASRTTGTVSPSGVSVATATWWPRLITISPAASSSVALSSGNSRSEATSAFTMYAR